MVLKHNCGVRGKMVNCTKPPRYLKRWAKSLHEMKVARNPMWFIR